MTNLVRGTDVPFEVYHGMAEFMARFIIDTFKEVKNATRRVCGQAFNR